MTATSNINHKDWTLFDRHGYIQSHGVEVQQLDDGTVRINATLHLDDELTVSEDGRRIDSPNGWYLTR